MPEPDCSSSRNAFSPACHRTIRIPLALVYFSNKSICDWHFIIYNNFVKKFFAWADGFSGDPVISLDIKTGEG